MVCTYTAREQQQKVWFLVFYWFKIFFFAGWYRSEWGDWFCCLQHYTGHCSLCLSCWERPLLELVFCLQGLHMLSHLHYCLTLHYCQQYCLMVSNDQLIVLAIPYRLECNPGFYFSLQDFIGGSIQILNGFWLITGSKGTIDKFWTSQR